LWNSFVNGKQNYWIERGSAGIQRYTPCATFSIVHNTLYYFIFSASISRFVSTIRYRIQQFFNFFRNPTFRISNLLWSNHSNGPNQSITKTPTNLSQLSAPSTSSTHQNIAVSDLSLHFYLSQQRLSQFRIDDDDDDQDEEED